MCWKRGKEKPILKRASILFGKIINNCYFCCIENKNKK